MCACMRAHWHFLASALASGLMLSLFSETFWTCRKDSELRKVNLVPGLLGGKSVWTQPCKSEAASNRMELAADIDAGHSSQLLLSPKFLFTLT